MFCNIKDDNEEDDDGGLVEMPAVANKGDSHCLGLKYGISYLFTFWS